MQFSDSFCGDQKVSLNQECTVHSFLSSKQEIIPRSVVRNYLVQTILKKPVTDQIRSRIKNCDVNYN